MRIGFTVFGVDVTLVGDDEYDFSDCSDGDLQEIIDSGDSEVDPTPLQSQAWHEQMVRGVRKDFE